MTAKRYFMSKVDTAWLRMEQPTNLMMITGVIGLRGEVDFQRLVDTIALRFLSFPRFRCRAVNGARSCYWTVDDDFDILSHVRRTALPGRADQAELQELVGELASTPLDPSKPLWQFHLVENYCEGPVLIARIHHCYADGMALVQVLLSLTDPGPEPRPSARSAATWKHKRLEESSVFRRFMEPAKDSIESMLGFWQKIWNEAQDLYRDPDQVGDWAHEIVEITEELASTLMLSDDPPTRLKGRLGVRKRVAWTGPLPLDEVKAVGRALGCTVNDVLIATITGAINHYLRSCGDDVEGVEIRATVPVNLRPLEHARELGNHFGLVYLPLPVGMENPLRRLLFIHEQMEALKNSRQAVVAFGLLAALGMGPAALQQPVLDLLSRKASAVLTNVPGPRQPLYIAGTQIREMMFWVPQNGSIGMGISIFSYNQGVYTGLITDRRLVPDPEAVTSRIQPEFEKLLYLALQLPDGVVEPEQAGEWLSAWLGGKRGDKKKATRRKRPAGGRTVKKRAAGKTPVQKAARKKTAGKKAAGKKAAG